VAGEWRRGWRRAQVDEAAGGDDDGGGGGQRYGPPLPPGEDVRLHSYVDWGIVTLVQ
jgi:hypothetical protein